jgi:hypothetical protein
MFIDHTILFGCLAWWVRTCVLTKAVREQVRNWASLVQCPSELEVPDSVLRAMLQLLVYSDGMLCQLDPSCC